ncbi:MAG: DUF5313 family protein [Pseudonocardia sp.]
MSVNVRRPGIGRWLWYAVSGRLDPRYREWAFRDLTCRTWPLRHLARLVVPALPVAAGLVAVLPGPLSVRLTATVTGVVIGLLYSFVFLHESTERRALKLGYPPGAAQAARDERREADELARDTERFLRDRSRRPGRWSRWW